MIDAQKVNKPVIRGKWRKYFGKRYFILKRRAQWLKTASQYASHRHDSLLNHVIIAHSSILLRPLKDVDMQYQHNKITNLKLAITPIDKLIIKPGQTFSLWYLVGKPSKKRGFLKGLVLQSGTIGYDYGGGLCQLGNLIYWMLLHSPLTVTERWRHGYDVFPDVNRKLPFGSGATLSYNYVDLQFKNTTDKTYQLHLYLTGERLHGEIRSENPSILRYEVYEDYHQIKHQFWGGYTRHNRLKRKTFTLSNQLLTDEVITENHAIMMYEPMISESNIK
ncbi:VanW family protein [Marinoscillum pacificum]|uniref:VanW family protein n=1 Tax=Marinoscillum pacificum TaxID=392723 RepID=UPI0021578670|nr:VanW family protein [Marinoscillum pacificum]